MKHLIMLFLRSVCDDVCMTVKLMIFVLVEHHDFEKIHGYAQRGSRIGNQHGVINAPKEIVANHAGHMLPLDIQGA